MGRLHNIASGPPGSQARKDYDRAYHYLTTHGITLEEYDELLALQGGRCAICGTTDPGGHNNRFHLDHDHACCPGTKSCGDCRRGLLCVKCNVGLGAFQDNPTRMRAALRYLEGDSHR